MSSLTIALSALFFTLLGIAYTKGYDYVKAHAPARLPQFYLIMAIIRFLLIATVVVIYAGLSDNPTDTLHFAAMILGMYVVMMVITLILKH